jgi:hypothetical protein
LQHGTSGLAHKYKIEQKESHVRRSLLPKATDSALRRPIAPSLYLDCSWVVLASAFSASTSLASPSLIAWEATFFAAASSSLSCFQYQQVGLELPQDPLY